MHSDDLQYELPERLIAQCPPATRRGSQLMVVQADHEHPVSVGPFAKTLPDELRSDDLVIINDTRVLHARITATRPTGGRVELLLLQPTNDDPTTTTWRTLARPAKRLRDGMELITGLGTTIACVTRDRDGWLVDLPVPASEAPAWLEAHGQLPLPPYITVNGQPADRYQTIYADRAGSVAAPTAGLHFDQQLLDSVRETCELATLTLHVGAGTFLPIRDGDLDHHTMHEERYEVPVSTDAAVRRARARGRRIVAVGSTSTRVLESVYGPAQLPLHGTTDLFLQPGYRFACVGAMVTNFHLPKSTLLALVMAFAGIDTTRAAYADAVRRELRFFSFGDAMFIRGRGVTDA